MPRRRQRTRGAARSLAPAWAAVIAVACTRSPPPAARTDPPRGLEALARSASLVPTPAEDHARFAHALGDELARHVEALPGVRRASVVLDVPRTDPFASLLTTAGRDAAGATASVVAVIEPGADPGLDRAIARLVAAGVDGLTADRVTAVVTPVTPSVGDVREPDVRGADTLHRVGPVQVAPGSATLLRGILGGLLAAVLALAGWLVVAERDRVRLRRLLAARSGDDDDATGARSSA